MTQDPADTPPPDAGSTEIPPGLQAAPGMPVNGHGAAVPPTAAQQTAQGVAALVQLAAQFPQQLVNILGQLPIRVIPQVRDLCAPCVIARVTWELSHSPELRKAEAAAREQLEISETDPFPPGFDPAAFLPEQLRPGAGSQGMPLLQPAVTTVGGTRFCAAHIPGLPGKSTLLIAQGALSSSLLSQFAA